MWIIIILTGPQEQGLNKHNERYSKKNQVVYNGQRCLTQHINYRQLNYIMCHFSNC
jgi:hypothetical protein